MDNLRIILWALFGGMLFVTWQQWQIDNAAPVVMPVAQQPVSATPSAQALPQPVEPSLPAPGTSAAVPTTPQLNAPAVSATVGQNPADTIVVETDVFRVEISRQGGNLVSALLPVYPVSKDRPNEPVQLLNSTPGFTYVIETGLVDGAQGGPTHLTALTAPLSRYALAPDQQVLTVPLTWRSPEGIEVTKVYTFKRGRYDVDLEYQIANRSDSEWRALDYLQIRRAHNPPERSMFDVDSYSFNGPVFYDSESYDKLDPDDFRDEPLKAQLEGGWLASIEHHFLSAAVPAVDAVYSYSSAYTSGLYTLRASGPTLVVPPDSATSVSAQFFVGPKLQEQLEETAPGLALTVDYGVLALLAQPLFWVLQQIFNLVGNWGWSIIIVTLLIKLTFYKLTETSGRSMAKMRKLQPRLKALQERYKDDRQQLSMKMMDLYKQEKVNPAAGCLPMLIQIPFFIAFYWVLLESVEMRQAPFALWITDLSTKDPFFVLPLLMGIAMFIQQKLNPAPPDPVQAKVMTILPIIFTVFFAFFPSGLVLYWLSNSVLSVAQQWNINRKMAVD